MGSRARFNRGDSRGRPVHENVLAVALWRLGAVEQEDTGLATSLCIGFSVNPLRRERPKSRGSQYGGGEHARWLGLFRCVLTYQHQAIGDAGKVQRIIRGVSLPHAAPGNYTEAF